MKQDELNKLVVSAILRLYGNIEVHTAKDRDIIQALYEYMRKEEEE